jgi:hypothetical protein
MTNHPMTEDFIKFVSPNDIYIGLKQLFIFNLLVSYET